MELRVRVNVAGLIDHTVIREAWNAALPPMLSAVDERANVNLSGRLVQSRTGELRASVREEIEPRADGLATGRVGTENFVGAILEAGASPHEIRPDENALLRFLLGSKWVTARRVEHPGIAKRPWLSTAVTESLPELELILGQALEDAVERRASLHRSKEG